MICHLLSELVLFSSKLSYTKSAKYKQREAITRIPPGNCPQSKVSKVSSSFNPQLPSFVDDWGTSQQSMFGLDRFLKRRHQNGKLQGFQGLGDVKRGGKMFFYFLIHLILFYFIIFYPLTDLLELVLPKDKVVNMY